MLAVIHDQRISPGNRSHPRWSILPLRGHECFPKPAMQTDVTPSAASGPIGDGLISRVRSYKTDLHRTRSPICASDAMVVVYAASLRVVADEPIMFEAGH